MFLHAFYGKMVWGDEMKRLKKTVCVLLFGSMLISLSACVPTTAKMDGIFTDNAKISYSEKYTELSATKKNKTKSWRQGMVSGNGQQGVITSGAPYSDSLIFQNMDFILPNKNVRYCPDTVAELEAVKQSIIHGEDITDNASYDDVYAFHPGGALRIAQKKHAVQDYIRYTDYETAQVGVRYTDKNGTWERKTFTSRADGVTVTRMDSSSTGSKINLTLSFDDISVLANYGNGDETNLQYKKLVSEDCSYLAMLAHYPNYENSELKNGGYATLTYILCENGTKEMVLGKAVRDEQYAAQENPQVQISNADAVYLITISDRTDDLGDYAQFAAQTDYPLLQALEATAKSVAEQYTQDGIFQYDDALQAHLNLYQPQFNAVTLSLGNGNSTQANETLLKAQKGKDEINSMLAQRTYYAGRYAYLCCSGYATTRLYGMWTGEWAPGWGSKYTMDANVNLQNASLNTSNMIASPIGYTYFLLRQLPDWEENARATHGFTDALQAPVNADGSKAVITETCYPYPFRYWNAGASWMLQPLFETLQCYGNLEIPLSDSLDLSRLKSVLSLSAEDLSDADITRLMSKGYLSLKEDILLPILLKSANYWAQLLSPEYYTDANGDIHYEQGKTALGANETYCILPSYSPENNPSNYPSPSTANCAIDIAACRSNLEMLLAVAKDVAPEMDTSKWTDLLQSLPPYLYDETGALKEWACNQFEENNEHRHLSHLYCVWPLNEVQHNEGLKQASIQAIVNRESENEASHALVHRALIASRLKDRENLTGALTNLMNHKIHYNSLMTNHDYDAGSCYCTDFAIGYLGIVHESLVYSNTGEIEILPALPTSGFDSGTITGLRTRTQAEITDLTWDATQKTAHVTIHSDIVQSINVSCGFTGETTEIHLQAGETKTVDFAL